jgi:hypothetical protein
MSSSARWAVGVDAVDPAEHVRGEELVLERSAYLPVALPG